jgi:multiple sugar transport system permease protein
VFVAPATLGILAFAIGPTLFAVWVSFHEWNLITPVTRMPAVGLDNYTTLTGDEVFTAALRNTVVFTVVGVGVNTLLGLGLAALLNTHLPPRPLWRTLFFLPLITSPVALGIMWNALLDQNSGALNTLLARFGLPPQPFLDSPDQALGSVIAIAVHQYVGLYVILFLAGLQAIPKELYEAARIDGAGAVRSFRSISLPLLRPVIAFVVITNTIGALQVFDIVFAATAGVSGNTSGGGPANATMVLVLHMYNTAFKFFRMGPATAMVVVLFALTLVVTLVQLRVARRRT